MTDRPDEDGESPTARAVRVWDTMAPRYDDQIAFFERIQFGGGREWVCSRAAGEVLEVAIGTGRNLPFYPPDVTLTGVELSPAMLAIAAQRAAELGHEVDLREGDAEALPFEDASFDTVVCTLSLCTIPDHARAIEEMARVLRRAARCCCSTTSAATGGRCRPCSSSSRCSAPAMAST